MFLVVVCLLVLLFLISICLHHHSQMQQYRLHRDAYVELLREVSDRVITASATNNSLMALIEVTRASATLDVLRRFQNMRQLSDITHVDVEKVTLVVNEERIRHIAAAMKVRGTLTEHVLAQESGYCPAVAPNQ